MIRAHDVISAKNKRLLESKYGEEVGLKKLFTISMLVMTTATAALVIGNVEAEDQETILKVYPDNLFGVDFFDEKHGIVTGYYGTVLRTSDGGKSWLRSVAKADGVQELLRRVDMVGPNTGYAVGHRGSIFKTTNGGLDWVVLKRLPGINLRDIAFVDELTGWVVGHEATVMSTRDGGLNWTKEELEGYSGRDLPRLNGVVAVDSSHAWLAGEFGVVAEFIEQGKWKLVDTKSSQTYTSLAMGERAIVVVGLDGKAIEISIAPETYGVVVPLETGSKQHLFDVTINASGKGYIAGKATLLTINGSVIESALAGSELALEYTWFGGVATLPSGEGWVVGRLGLIANTPSQQNPFQQTYRLGSPVQNTPSK